MTQHTSQPESMAKMNRLYLFAEYTGIAAFIREQTNTDAIRLDGRAIRMVFETPATADGRRTRAAGSHRCRG